VVALVAAGVGYRLTRPDDAAPAGAPKPGSCWAVDEAAVHAAFPWPGQPVDCTKEHTAEVFHVAKVDPPAQRDPTLRDNLMYAQARRACTLLASAFLGGDWHTGRVTVVADWVKPATAGHFGCAVVESADPAGTRLVHRSGSLRDALKQPGLATECVTGRPLAYADCAADHDGEFVGTYTITPPDTPFDEAAVKQAAEHGCTQTALAFLGLPADGARPDLRTGYVGPLTASDWLGSDQTFACYALALGGRKLRGSIKGLGQRDLGH
jgi:Septum formation